MSVRAGQSLNISPSDLKIPKSETDLDKYLRRKYLPLNFEWNEQEAVKEETRKRFYRKIKFDLKELLHLFSTLVLIIWLLALIIFLFYLEDDCSVFARHSPQPGKVHNGSSLSNQTLAHQNGSESAVWTPTSTTSSSKLNAIVHHLKHFGHNKTTASTPSECVVVTIFAITDFALASIMALYLSLYLFHIVEMAIEFPWFAVEISFVSIFLLALFGLEVALCINGSSVDLWVILGMTQIICAAFFILDRYTQCQAGRLPQTLSEAADGYDYFRSFKNIFHSMKQGRSDEQNSLVQAGGKRAKVGAVKSTLAKGGESKSKSDALAAR